MHVSFRSPWPAAVALAVLTGAVAAARSQTAPLATADDDTESPTTLAALPRPDAEAILRYLDAAEFQNRWRRLPRLSAENGSPGNGMTNVYLNPIAEEALDEGQPVPDGGMLVLSEITRDDPRADVSVMYKAPAGYDRQHGDWFWLERRPNGTIVAAGHVTSCQQCHEQGDDYVRSARDGGHPAD